MPDMSFEDELSYSGELFRAVQEQFVTCIPAVEFTDLKCISDKLTNEEMVCSKSIYFV